MSGWVSYWHHRVGHHHHHSILLFCFVLVNRPMRLRILILEISQDFLSHTPLVLLKGSCSSMLPAAFVSGVLIFCLIFIHLCHELHHGALRNLHHLLLHLSQMSPHLSLLNQEQNQAGTVYYRQYAHAVQDQTHLPGQPATTLPKASGSSQLSQWIQHSEFNSEIQKKVFKNCNAQLTIQHFQKVSWIIKV